MVNGQVNRDGIIVYSFEDLKRLYPENKKRGMWAFHSNYHEGHERCAKAVQHCDWVVGVLYNNMADGEKWMTGVTYTKTTPILQSDIESLKKYSDVCLILTGDYHPYKEHWNLIKSEFEEQFPIECLKEKGILDDQLTYNVLLYSVAYRVLMHGIYKLYFDYQAQGGKDPFRTIGYLEYVYDRWGVHIDLLDPVRDHFGNSISNTIAGLPKHLKDKINKPLLQ
jgi:hypothetical protein